MKKKNFQEKEKDTKLEFEQKLVDLARVTRVTGGGKRMSFRALVVLGDRQGKVGYGLAKGKDVTSAVTKAVEQAQKIMIKVPLKKGTIAHEIRHKFNSARILLKPAPLGTGVKAGGPLRVVLDLAGIENVVAKMLGSSNKVNNVKCVYEALASLKNKTQETRNK